MTTTTRTPVTCPPGAVHDMKGRGVLAVPAEIHAELLSRAGARVRTGRLAAGMTQQQLADRIGMVRSSVANLEQGRQDMTISRLAGIALVLNLDLAALIAADELPPQPHDVMIRPVLEVSCRTCGGTVLDVTDSRSAAQESRSRHIDALGKEAR